MAVLAFMPQDRVFTRKDVSGVYAVLNGVVYRKFSEHCDYQGLEVVSTAQSFCHQLSRSICLAGRLYQEKDQWFFELWLAEDSTDWFVGEMRKRGFYKPEDPRNEDAVVQNSVGEFSANATLLHSQMVRSFCRVVSPMLPLPVDEVKSMLARYGLPARSLATPKRQSTCVVVRCDGDQCIAVMPA